VSLRLHWHNGRKGALTGCRPCLSGFMREAPRGRRHGGPLKRQHLINAVNQSATLINLSWLGDKLKSIYSSISALIRGTFTQLKRNGLHSRRWLLCINFSFSYIGDWNQMRSIGPRKSVRGLLSGVIRNDRAATSASTQFTRREKMIGFVHVILSNFDILKQRLQHCTKNETWSVLLQKTINKLWWYK